MALKMLKKTEIIRLKQIEHVKSEKKILEHIDHPFIVTLCVPLSFLTIFSGKALFKRSLTCSCCLITLVEASSSRY